MPKPFTFPTLLDSTMQINISDLRKWGCLKPNRKTENIITWSSRGNQTGRIGITICTFEDAPYIELNYQYGNEPRKYKVYLDCVPSNLGKGEVWYFLCPKTHKRCRKLYSVDGYFFHREAFNGCMY